MTIARRAQMVLDEYKHRYDRERSRLQDALVKAANCAQVVSDGLAECLAIERQLFGYRFPPLPQRNAPTTRYMRSLHADVLARISFRSYGNSMEELHTPRRPKPETPSLLQAMGGMSIANFDHRPEAFIDRHTNGYPYDMGG